MLCPHFFVDKKGTFPSNKKHDYVHSLEGSLLPDVRRIQISLISIRMSLPETVTSAMLPTMSGIMGGRCPRSTSIMTGT